MKPATITIGVLVLLLAATAVYLMTAASTPLPEETACTLEAKLCPDGSYVGRTGPNCEFAACPGVATSSGGGIAPYESGIRGTVMLGPTCPVERIPPDPDCADRPYQTLVVVFRASDPVHAIAFAKSDAKGMFAVSLPPGEYVVGAGESNLPQCSQLQATVGPGAYTDVLVSCDTGIR